MTNLDYIEKYKGDKRIISDYYLLKTKEGKVITLDGIVNPLKIDNRQLMSPTDDQASTPHCAAYSAATLAESIYWKRTGILKQFDSHQVYALAKQLDSEVYTDGTYLEYALKAAIKLYAFENADKLVIKTYSNTNDYKTIDYTKFLVHKYDFLQAGFYIDEGWYRVTSTNHYIEPNGAMLGGHAVNIVGYDQEGVYILNQWGTSWGAKGFAIMRWPVYLKQLMYGAYIENAYS